MGTDAVTVVGAGGIGSAVGAALRAAGVAVTFVEANPAKVAWGRANGLGVVPFAEWTPDEHGVILLCVKCYDNATVLAKVPFTATLIPIQNGFDPRLDSFGHSSEGIASFVAACPADRIEARITRPGELHLGGRGDRLLTAGVKWLMGKLDRPGTREWFVPKLVANVLPVKHTKLLYNAAISPLAAAAGIDNGQLLSDPHARRLFFALIQENYTILTAAGIELGKVGPFHPRTVAKILRRRWLARLMARAFEPSLRGTYCSMAGEIERGRTEIENYNGHLLRLADGRADAPLNRAVYALVKRMEANREPPRRAALAQLGTNLGFGFVPSPLGGEG
jgi:2-dehydropantoate 2-reductase